MRKKVEYGYDGNMLTVEELVTQHVPRGWETLVTMLVLDLFRLGWTGRLYQVKEKFGGLRFYCVSDGDPQVGDRIEAAERESYRTCIYCGYEGTMRSPGWIHPACDACYQDELDKRNQGEIKLCR